MALKTATLPAKKVAKKIEARTVIATGEYEGHPMLYVGPEVIADGERTGQLDPRSKYANLQGSEKKFAQLLHVDAENEPVLLSLVQHLLDRIPEDRFVEALDSMDALVLWYLAARKDVATATLAQTGHGEDISGFVMSALAAE